MKYLTTYVSTSTDPVTRSKDMQGARELTSHLITSVWLIYIGHDKQNPNYINYSQSYKDYQSWFSDQYDCQTTLTEDEAAVKNLLYEFDKNFDVYKDSKFFKAFLKKTTVPIGGYRDDKEQTKILNYNELIRQTMRNGELIPISELNAKASSECADLEAAITNIKNLAEAKAVGR